MILDIELSNSFMGKRPIDTKAPAEDILDKCDHSLGNKLVDLESCALILI